MFQKKFIAVSIFAGMLLSPWQPADAAAITVAVVAKDGDTYHRALAALKGADAEFIERRDLSALLKEKELAQQGLTQAQDVDFKAAQYLVLLEEAGDSVNGRIVNRAGKIISAHQGKSAKIYPEIKLALDGEAGIQQLFAAKPKKGLHFSIAPEKSTLKEGDIFNFYISDLEGEAYLYVLVLQSDGVLNVLAPYKQRRYIKLKMRRDDSYDFDKESGLHIRATKPYGKDTIKVIVSRQPLELLEQHLTGGDVRSVKPGGRGPFTRGMTTSIRQLADGDWGEGVEIITVNP